MSAAHGTLRRAKEGRCICERCRRVSADHAAMRRRALAYGTPLTVPGEVVRGHIAQLRVGGRPLAAVAQVAGVPLPTLQGIVNGKGGRPPATRVRRATALAIERAATSGARAPLVGAVDARLTVERVTALRDVGWTCPEIARAAGISRATVSRLSQGRWQTVSAETEDGVGRAVLALDAAGPPRRPAPEPATVPALGARRRARALRAAGYSDGQIAAASGLSASVVSRIVNRGQERVRRSTHDALRGAYEALDCRGPDGGRQDPGNGVLARRRRDALEVGWLTPMAWDDPDDPAERQGFDRRRRPGRRT